MNNTTVPAHHHHHDTGVRHTDDDGAVYALYVPTGTRDYAEVWVRIA